MAADDVSSLIKHLLQTQHSIDTVESIIKHVHVSNDRLRQILADLRYVEYFQLLRPSSRQLGQASEKVALTLDLFCCTHYAQKCRNQSCPFLHLCPYNIRPMHTKCTNRHCQFTHDVLESEHNQRIIRARGLPFFETSVLHELARASANPNRSFWICMDYAKKDSCPDRSTCTKLHYCYYALTDSCTKARCPHTITDACLKYFRHKDIAEQDTDDILLACRKVLRQRKFDYVDTLVGPHPASTASATPKPFQAAYTHRASKLDQKRSASSGSRKTPSASWDEDLSSTKIELPVPLPPHDQDILLSFDPDDEAIRGKIRNYLSDQIGCPVNVLISKSIASNGKESQRLRSSSTSVPYYCPITETSNIFQLLRWQNSVKNSMEPLIVYANARDAHDAAEQNPENNQFCIFRVQLLQDNVVDPTPLPGSRRCLNDPSTVYFDRMWIYVFDL